MAVRRIFWRSKRVLRQRHRREKLLRFWLPLAAIVFLFFVLSGIIVFAWFSRDLPNPDRISDRSVAQSTRIYARDGTTLLYEIHGDQRRTVVELADISPSVINATIAIEDKDFRKHQGFSLTGIVRAIWKDLTTGSSQGGSTITQQFVKNAVLTSEKKLTRKIRELVLAYQIERRFTKDQILKLYFNEIPYGANAYGSEAAAETFFGKPAKSLTLAESAVLAALPQAPTFYSPYGNHTDQLLRRAHHILDLMVEQQYITKEEAAAAKAENVLQNVKPKRETILAPHFVFYVRELLTNKYGEKTVERDGLRVITTLDIEKQNAAEQAIADQAAINEKRWDANNAALVAIDPKTGQILAMVGSKDYFDTTIDGNVNVALTLQQPGSSIKPIVYATAFSRGFTPETIIFDLVTRFKVAGAPDYVPRNYNGKENGPVAMRKALAGSLNIPAVKTLYLAGVDHVIDQAQKMGYTTWADRSRLGLSLVLGGADITLLEHTAAFGSLAADGALHATTPILRAEDKSGKVLEEFKDQSSKVLEENIARTVTDILSDNEARSFIFGSRNRLTLPDRPVAAKTGTTQEYRDAWTMGYTPSLMTGVWVGNTKNKPMRLGADGSVVAAPIWNAFMRKALAGTKTEGFKKPKPITTTKPILQGKIEGEAPINVDKVTGNEIPSSCLDSWPPEFVSKKTVRAVHTILYYVDPSDPDGPPPKSPEKNSQFTAWEKPIQDWAKKNKYVEKRPPLESCSLRTARPEVTVVSPGQNETVHGNSLTVTTAVTSSRPLASVQFSLDDDVVSPVGSTTQTITIDTSAIEDGFHTVSIVATDDIGNSTSANLTVNIVHQGTTSSLFFVTPSNGAEVVGGTTMEIRAFAFDPSLVVAVTFKTVAPDGTTSDLGTVTPDSASTAVISWNVPSVAGAYKLGLAASTSDGRSLQSDALTVNVH
ncbi:MAG: PBP1A family penicillin-binding protein [Candidatus Kerfeldbacteria bacterium]|nr:PBP1A family penicillin-binding protein [Candidatus Kerfeldbacteria bacterium]